MAWLSLLQSGYSISVYETEDPIALQELITLLIDTDFTMTKPLWHVLLSVILSFVQLPLWIWGQYLTFITLKCLCWSFVLCCLNIVDSLFCNIKYRPSLPAFCHTQTWWLQLLYSFQVTTWLVTTTEMNRMTWDLEQCARMLSSDNWHHCIRSST